MKHTSRTLAACAVVLIAAGGSLLLSGTAQAKSIDCENHLQSLGYSITYAIRDGCRYGEYGFTRRCWEILTGDDVIYYDANEACRRAAL